MHVFLLGQHLDLILVEGWVDGNLAEEWEVVQLSSPGGGGGGTP